MELLRHSSSSVRAAYMLNSQILPVGHRLQSKTASVGGSSAYVWLKHPHVRADVLVLGTSTLLCSSAVQLWLIQPEETAKTPNAH